MLTKFINQLLFLSIIMLNGCASIVDFSEGRPLKEQSLPTVQVFLTNKAIYTPLKVWPKAKSLSTTPTIR